MQPIVQLQGIGKHYQQGDQTHVVLHNIDFCLHEGDFIAICGPSGHGKSTLLSILALLEQPSEGSYHLAGTLVSRLDLDQAALLRGKHMGIVFQSFNLIGDLSVADNVALPLQFAKHIDKNQHADLIQQAIAAVGLSDKSAFFPDMLSGGQQQRVAIARAIVHQPDVIFADEPTGNLDPDTANQIMTLLQQLHRQGVTVCMVTHDQQLASQAQQIYTMKQGQLSLQPSF